MTDILSTASVWDRITDGPDQETEKSWAAFQQYRDMPIHGKKTQRRSYGNLALLLDHNSTTTIEGWARRYHWRERVQAYDAHMGRKLIVVREMGLEKYKEAIIGELTQELALATMVINRSLQDMIDSEEAVEPKALNQLLLAIEKKDNLARRAVGMPTTYTSEPGQDIEQEDTVYYAGGE
jgi:hypothetical protein